MNLKKNDKIIAVVGVIILVLAAIGIIFYYSTEDTEENGTEDEMETFYVDWERKEVKGQTITGMCQGESYMESFTVSAPSGYVLTSVEMTLSFEDDNTWGILTKKGQDSIVAKITGPSSGNVNEIAMNEDGNDSLRVGIYDIPSSMEIEAETEDEAMQQVEDEYMNSCSAEFDLEVTVTPGETFKFLMPVLSLIHI